jgi:hypothetical protein
MFLKSPEGSAKMSTVCEKKNVEITHKVVGGESDAFWEMGF